METKRILAAVDDFSSQAYLKNMFKHLGINANWAYGWNGVLMHLERGGYDALLLDDQLIPNEIQCPAEWLRNRGHRIPVIIMTEMSAIRRPEASAGMIINKPVSPLRLMKVLDAVVESENSRDNIQIREGHRMGTSSNNIKDSLQRYSHQ